MVAVWQHVSLAELLLILPACAAGKVVISTCIPCTCAVITIMMYCFDMYCFCHRKCNKPRALVSHTVWVRASEWSCDPTTASPPPASQRSAVWPFKLLARCCWYKVWCHLEVQCLYIMFWSVPPVGCAVQHLSYAPISGRSPILVCAPVISQPVGTCLGLQAQLCVRI